MQKLGYKFLLAVKFKDWKLGSVQLIRNKSLFKIIIDGNINFYLNVSVSKISNIKKVYPLFINDEPLHLNKYALQFGSFQWWAPINIPFQKGHHTFKLNFLHHGFHLTFSSPLFYILFSPFTFSSYLIFSFQVLPSLVILHFFSPFTFSCHLIFSFSHFNFTMLDFQSTYSQTTLTFVSYCHWTITTCLFCFIVPNSSFTRNWTW